MQKNLVGVEKTLSLQSQREKHLSKGTVTDWCGSSAG